MQSKHSVKTDRMFRRSQYEQMNSVINAVLMIMQLLLIGVQLSVCGNPTELKMLEGCSI